MRPQRRRRLHLRDRRLDEQRHPDAGGGELVDEGSEVGGAGDGIQAALGGPLLAPFRNQADGVRLMPERDAQHLVAGRHFQIERRVHLPAQADDIVVGDVAAILAQVRGDAVGAGTDGEFGRPHRVGMAAAAGVADGGDVVDVDAEAKVRGHRRA